MINENVVIAVAYATFLTLFYIIIKNRYIETMVKKQIITTAGGKELKMVMETAYIVLLVIGVFIALVDIRALIYLILTALAVIAITSHDVIKSIFLYYMIVLTKMITQGDFVIMARGIRGWVKKLTPFYVELHGEHGEIIRIPNILAASEPVRVPSKALPFTLLIRIHGQAEINEKELREKLDEVIAFTKRFCVTSPHVKIRSVGTNFVEYEVIYGLSNYEASNRIIEILYSKLKDVVKEINGQIEIRREHTIMSKL
ncbi:hypothetical protein IPA_04975 [Ignicoccus pacificus DSM 13166]|uniref:Mechanosensitive ion channel n=1 Tax=Ignicoccus pacificus DSM 13166 TaxID=940294 RepID=A0A977PKW8_9CREN|nr:hypothetical protein IPA_04975 [Ignicoccus pacificus DSM 13166]